MRGKGEGSIGKRKDGRYYAYLTITEPSGKTKRQYYYAKTRREVESKLLRGRRDREEGRPVIPDRQTVAAYLTEWLETTGQATLRRTTLGQYTRYVKRYVVPGIGGILLRELGHQDIQRLLNEMHARGLSTGTCRYMKSVLSRALMDAWRSGRVNRNAAALAIAPRSDRREMKVWTPEQVRIFLQTAKGHRWEALFNVALVLGLRRGELLALKWRDIDVNRGTLTVRGTLSRLGGETIITDPKTKSSRRTIVLPKFLIAQLQAHRRRQLRQMQDQAEAGFFWNDVGLVFTNMLGGPIIPLSVVQRFHTLTRKAGLPLIRVHDMRHTAATCMLSSGIPVKVVSEILGHSNIRITLDLYAHVLDEQREDAAERMDRMFGGA